MELQRRFLRQETMFIAELDEKGRIMGIEIWNASKRGVMEELRKAVMMSSKQ